MAEDPSGEHGRRTNLGRGLAALFGEESEEGAAPEAARAARTLPIDRLEPNPFQPRRSFEPETLQALADSIGASGLLQPLLVRPAPEGGGAYQIVAGERRWRAAQLAQLHEVPVIVRELDDRAALEAALVENVQRQDLSAIEEAEGYQRLIDEFKHTQEDLARALGKSRSHIANTLRLLGLPAAVKDLVLQGRLSAGHARALIGAGDPEALAKKVLGRGLNVRQTERLVQAERAPKRAAPGGKAAGTAAAKDADTLALERDLGALLGLKVSIDIDGPGGRLVIHYKTLEQLDDVLQRLSHPPAKGGEGV